MRGKIARFCDYMLDHYAMAGIFIAQIMLTFLGVGDPLLISVLGLLLCAIGIGQKSSRPDMVVLIPLIAYSAFCMASSWNAYGDLSSGYGSLHLILPVLYLLLACLDGGERENLRKLCAAWTGAVAAIGIAQFVAEAVSGGRAGRLGGILGNPNAMGAFLVLGWFLLLDFGDGRGGLRRLEPLILVALALTLSMGSFLAMGVGVVVALIQRWHERGRKEALSGVCRLLAKVSLAMGTGLLMYVSGARTVLPWSCLFPAAYAVALTIYWPRLELFLERYSRLAVLIAVCGVAVAVAAVAVRPSSGATFAERIEMMGSGAAYLGENPLFGVGPLRWRQLDLYDGGKYFNTWHIHNVPLHVAVEMGWPAAICLLLVAARLLWRKKPAVWPGFIAFCVHNLIDTSFFYLGISSLALIGVDNRDDRRTILSAAKSRALFGCFAALYAVHLFQSL